MAPRKSKSGVETSSDNANLPSSKATSSRITLDDIPMPELSEDLTPGFERLPGEKRFLNEEERERLIQELIGFYPRSLCDQITDIARNQVATGVLNVELRLKELMGGRGEDVEREVDMGLHTLETLLDSHVDKAFDRFTAWTLRNSFDVPNDLELVLPWHHDLDFARGEYVASLPKGEDTLVDQIQQLRNKVEQSRLLSYRLAQAEVQMDRRLEIARQRKAEIGFVRDVLASSGLNPLPERTAQTKASLSRLHSTLIPLDPSLSLPLAPRLPASAQSGEGSGTKAWELGRQAYLNWAVGQALSAGAGAGSGAGAGLGASVSGAGAAGDVEMREEMERVDGNGLEALRRTVA